MVISSIPTAVSAADAALGTYENPYLLFADTGTRLAVSVAAGDTAYIKADNYANSVVTVGYATSADYTVYYGRTTVFPADDGTLTFSMDNGINELFAIENNSGGNLTAYINLESVETEEVYGTMDNPEVLTFEDGAAGDMSVYALRALEAGNQGYYFSVTAPDAGVISVSAMAYDEDYNEIGWSYFVNNLTAGTYGNINYSDDEEPVPYAEIKVSEGDELQIFVATYDPENMWISPAGNVSVSVSFYTVGSLDRPEKVTAGNHSTTFEKGDQGYYYQWTATEEGTVTVTMKDEDGWMYNLSCARADGSYSYGDTHWPDDDPVVFSEKIGVMPGDVLTIFVATYDPANVWTTPAGTVNWNLSFESAASPAVPEGLVYEITDGSVTITDYTGSATGLVIPETIEGYPVTVIGDYAFHECSGLARITLPASVTSIGDCAFNSCKGLTSIILSEGIISIGDYVFNGSINLKSLTIPASVTSFGVGNVARCNSLVSLNVAEGNSTYYSEGNCIIKAADGVLVAGCNKSVIPAGVRCIGTQAFSNCISIESIIIPDGVTSIEDYAFTICTNLTSIDIPDSVITIGMHAFSLCESLTSIILPENLTTIGQSAFYNCIRLESITISENVTHIDKNAFYNCSNLSTVYYGGTEEEWNAISIGSNNDDLTNADIIFLGEAEEPDVPEVPESVLGDINGDGKVNGKDSFFLGCVITGRYEDKEGLSDINGDRRIDARDSYLLKRIIVGDREA